MKVFLSALIASFFLYLSFATAASEFESLESRTQFDFTGGASFSSYDGFSWSTSAAGFHYITPHFGIGGVVGVDRWAAGTNGVGYSIGPAAEYFVPVGERGHLFTQISASYNGLEKATGTTSLAGRLGYRYFVSEDIAVSIRFVQSWRKDNVSGASTRTADPTLQWGFSLFF